MLFIKKMLLPQNDAYMYIPALPHVSVWFVFLLLRFTYMVCIFSLKKESHLNVHKCSLFLVGAWVSQVKVMMCFRLPKYEDISMICFPSLWKTIMLRVLFLFFNIFKVGNDCSGQGGPMLWIIYQTLDNQWYTLFSVIVRWVHHACVYIIYFNM